MKSKVSMVQIDLTLQQLQVKISLSEQSESLPGKDVKSGSPTDDDFQPAKKRFRTPGNNQVIKFLFTYLEYLKRLAKFRFKAGLNEGLYKQFNETRQ